MLNPMFVLPSHSLHGDLRKSHLSTQRQRLVSLAQRLCFGTIQNLHIAGGEPVLDPLPRVIRRKKMGGINQPRPQVNTNDFVLKQDWFDLFNDIDAIGDGVILLLEITHGLPLIYEFEDVILV